MAHDVFVSHSSKDKPTADAVCAMLESQGIRCWVAPRDITPGMDWGEAIVEAVKGARVMVLVFSASANNSPQIKREVERAVNKGIPVIPLRIEDVAPTASLEYFISTPHWLDAFTPPLETHLRYLAQIIHQVMGKRPGEAAARPGVLLDSPTVAPSERSRETTAPKRVSMVPIIGGAFALLAILVTSWWFGIERPRREEARKLIAAERERRADAENQAARMTEEQQKMRAEMEAARRAEEKRQAAEALKIAQNQRDEEAAKAAAKQRAEEEAAKRAEEMRMAEANAVELAKKEADRKEGERKAAENAFRSRLVPDNGSVDRANTVPVSETNSPGNPLTVFELIKEANLSIGAQSKDQLIYARSDKSIDALTPSTWHLGFEDTASAFQSVEVSFRAGKKLNVSNPPKVSGIAGVFGVKTKIFDVKKLKVDSDKGLRIALEESTIKDLKLTASQMWLEWYKNEPVWKIQLWAAKYRNPNDKPEIGRIFISAEDGKVLQRDWHPERVR